MRRFFLGLVIAVSALLLVVPPAARAQGAPAFTSEQLAQMLAPIALYPDALLSQVLMASTYPSDVAEAVTWAKANRKIEGDAAVKAVESKPWDPSVQSLVAFPQVLAIMGEKPAWVQDLGDAFLASPNAVMDSVQQLRQKAQEAGNLKSGEQITVATEPAPARTEPVVVGAPPPPQQIIVIQPANPQVIYVPSYNPTVVFGPWWYPSYPPYYIRPAPFWGFGAGVVTAGIAWGVAAGVNNALWGGMNWGRGDVNINVNRYNNINVNNRINSSNNNVNWRHNSANRNGVPYRDANTRDRNQNQLPGRDNRQEYRGRDTQRMQAEQALSNRVGQGNVDRSNLQNIDRNTLQNRGGGGEFGGGARDRVSASNNRPNNANLSQAQNRRDSGNVDNALRGAGNGAQTRQQIDRGAASRETMNRAQNSGGGAQRSQSVQRPQNMGGGGTARPQPNRNGGGGATRQSGGGGARGGRR